MRWLVIAWLAGCVGCVNLADKLLLWPPSAVVPSDGARRELIETASGTIEAFVARSMDVEPEAFIVRFYGNGELATGRVVDEAATFAGVAVELWAVNYPGYGGSQGDATLEGVARGALAAYDAVAARAGTRPVIVAGTSMGAAAALHVAARRAVAGIVVQDPPPFRQLVLLRHGWWNLWFLALVVAHQLPRELDTLRNAANARAPAIIVSSLDDGVVPVKYQRDVVRAYAGPFELLEVAGAEHAAPMPHWVRARIIAWLGALIASR